MGEGAPVGYGETTRTSQAVGARLAARLDRFHVLHGCLMFRTGMQKANRVASPPFASFQRGPRLSGHDSS